MNHQSYTAMLKFAMLSVLVIPFCGCSSTYPVLYITNAELNEELAGQYATIESHERKEILAKEVRIYNDSASWRDARTGQESNVSIGKLSRIDIVKKDRVLGGVEGLALGALGGAGVGWLTTSGKSEGYRREYQAVAMFAYGLIGAAVGLITGAIIGHSEHYEFQLTEERDSGTKTHIEKSSTKMDVLYLKNGNVVRGTITVEMGDAEYLRYVILRNAEGQTRTYYGVEIDRIEKGN